MTDYEFTIVATGLSLDDDDWQERFFEAGCDDALVAIQRGMFVLRFDREASSFSLAVESAIRDVDAAGAKVVRVEPDPLVSASDISERSGLSRQLISLYANGSRGKDFPIPVACVTTSKPFWKWSHAARWLANNGKLEEDAVAQAEAIELVNDRIAGIGLGASSTEATAAINSIAPVSQYADIAYYIRSDGARKIPAEVGRFRTDVTDIPPHGAEFLRPSSTRAAACL